jgi:hypothetical protein
MGTKQYEEYTETVDDTAPDNGTIAVFPPLHPADNGAVGTSVQAIDTTPHAIDVSTHSPAPTTFEQRENAASDRHDAQHERASRWQKAIYLLFGVLAGLIFVRFLLPLLGASPNAGFARFIQGIASPFAAPFAGLFGLAALNTLVAILAYMGIAWILAQVVWLAMGEMRRGKRR